MSAQVAPVAVLGLGAMGLGMAQCLVKAFPVRGFDVAPARVELAAAEGVVPATSAAQAVAGATVAVVSVRDGAQLREVALGAGGAGEAMAAGSVLVITSTVGAAAVREVAAALEPRGVLVVDAPVSGGPVRAAAGDLLVMVGASDEALAVAGPVLHALASKLAYPGGVGSGQDLKTVNQLLCGIHTAAANEALALAHAMGLDLDSVIETLGTGAAASFMLSDRGPRAAQQLRGEKPPLRSRLDVIAKDMGIVGDLTRQYKLAAPVAAAAEQLFRLAMAAGLEAEDDSIVSTVLTKESWRGRAGSASTATG